MTVKTYQGIVEKGKILLREGAQLPERATVYVIVTDEALPVAIDGEKPVQILSPHFVRREDAVHFKLTVTEEKPNA